MRILVSSTPGLGHVHPLVHLARAFARRGHDVHWGVGVDAHPTIEAAGLKPFAAGLTGTERMAEFWRRYPQARELPPEDVPAFMFPRLFGEITMPPLLDDLLAHTDEWRPDVMVHEVGDFAAPIVAGLIGIPHVTEGFGAQLRPERLPLVNEFVAPYWEALGLEPRPRCGSYDYLYLDIYPPSLDPGYEDPVEHRQLLRPIENDDTGGDDVREWLDRDDDRPLLYVTFGTVFNATEGSFRAAIDAIRDLDVRALVTVGPRGDPEAFGDTNEHLLVARYVPQHVTLERCTLVVSHAGSGTFLASLARGIPQLCLPQAADQFTNAGACERARAGLQLLPADATRANVKDAIESLLRDPSFRDGAERVKTDIAAMPDPDEVAAVIETRFSA